MRVTAQLIDTTTEGHLWAQNYDRQLEDVFAIQSEIAEKVAGELKIRLVDSEKHVREEGYGGARRPTPLPAGQGTIEGGDRGVA